MSASMTEEVAPARAELLEHLGETVSRHANARTVYGEPVERGGVVVIPVASVRWGFGGGRGRQRAGEEGAGGGGGAVAVPVGFIEMKEGQTRFQPIREPGLSLRMAFMAGVFAWLVLRGIRRLW